MVIYEPKGKAREYCELAVNLYTGCENGCWYCYAPAVLKKKKEDFINVKIRHDILENIKKEAWKHEGKEVLLCFSCDPYPGVYSAITREAIRILNENGLFVNILTKGGKRSEHDFDILEDVIGNKYGTTLTYNNDMLSSEFEPKAAPYSERIEALKEAYRRGIYTWVSLEPVISDEMALFMVEMTREYVDEYKVGKLNYHKSDIDWKRFGNDIVEKLEKHGKKHYIKEDLRKLM